ncbi:MAG: hypothetical protein ACLKAL_13420 [Alkaliphilus sp.]
MKQTISILLVMLLLVVSLSVSSSFAAVANTWQGDDVRTNLQILVNNGESLVYTYTQEGQNYKNVETITKEFIHSSIYIIDKKTGKKQLVQEFKTSIAKLEDTVRKSKAEQKDALKVMNTDPTKLSYSFYMSIDGSNKPKTVTLACILVILGVLIPGATSTFAGALAALIYQGMSDTIYHT